MIRLCCAGVVAALSLLGQPSTIVSFEAASVKPSHPTSNWIRALKKDTPGRIVYENFPLKDLIRDAWGMKDYQVKAASWLRNERYDIVATKPRGTTPERLQLMMRSLLQDRFHLTVHTERRELPGYVLLPGKDTSKLRPALGVPGVPGCQSFGTMSEFAGMLSRRLDRPVANETAIPGVFYFILAWSDQLAQSPAAGGVAPPPPPPAQPPPCPGWSAATMPPLASSIFEAVKEQMGLRLVASHNKVPVDLLIVDNAVKLPDTN